MQGGPWERKKLHVTLHMKKAEKEIKFLDYLSILLQYIRGGKMQVFRPSCISLAVLYIYVFVLPTQIILEVYNQFCNNVFSYFFF